MLANGYYGEVTIDRNYTSEVTIKSATPLGATFDGININNSSYLKLDGVHVDSPTNTGGSLIGIAFSDHITVVNSEVNGKVDNVYPITSIFGINVDDSSYINISNNNVHDVLNGITFSTVDHLVASGNNVDYIGADAFKFGNVDTALIENNTGPSYLYPTADTHSDFMQFQGYPSSNLIIRGNVFLPQNRFDTQGIFVAGDGGHTNVLIENTIIHSGMHNGIFVAKDSSNVRIRDNTLIAADGDVTRIVAPDAAAVANNIFSGRQGALEGGNLSMQGGDAKDRYYIGDLFPGWVLGRGLSFDQLQPKAGSPATTMGAVQRLGELLSR